jgi:hypothetical protein
MELVEVFSATNNSDISTEEEIALVARLGIYARV